jgi:hypothetical protein
MMRMKAMRIALVAVALTVIFAPAALAEEDEWQFGIGTGFFGLNIDGDVGITTALGPVDLDASMTGDEVRDLLESAFGFGGFAAKGKWAILYAGTYLELEDTITGVGPLGSPVSSTVTFTQHGAEVAAAYRFALKGKNAWSVLGGLRYTKHEYDLGLSIDNDPPNPPAELARNIDHDWTDLLIGLTHARQINDRWTWTNRLDAGFGGSDGTFFYNTSFNWQFAESWAMGIYGQITSIDFENDNRGDPDWYAYDANEYGLGLSILYTF